MLRQLVAGHGRTITKRHQKTKPRRIRAGNGLRQQQPIHIFHAIIQKTEVLFAFFPQMPENLSSWAQPMAACMSVALRLYPKWP